MHEYEHINPLFGCIRTRLANIRAQAKPTASHIKINTLFKVGLHWRCLKNVYTWKRYR